MRTSIAAASIVLITLRAAAQAPEDRLIEAELLEVSAGDLERAMAIYKALAADEKAPEPVRARALLSLARSQRKVGQLEAAKKTLEALVRSHAREGEILRQARSFLEELETGRARNPDFDWIREVEKNPEIQARVFDWTMSLAGSDEDAAATAARQLQALGTIALPVVERVLDASRDETQREILAMIAVRAGRLERLAGILEGSGMVGRGGRGALWKFSFETYLGSVLQMTPEERRKVLAEAAKIPEAPANRTRRTAILLAAGDTADLAARLASLDARYFETRGLLDAILERDPGAADVFAARAKEKALRLEARERYFAVLLRKAPEKLGPEHFDIVDELAASRDNRDQASIRDTYIPGLEKSGRFDVLEKLAPGAAAYSIHQYFDSTYASPGRLEAAPGKWGAILRRMRALGEAAFPLLHRLGEANDEAAAELAAFLAARRSEGPEYLGFGPRKDHAWTPSPRYAELMAGLLDSDDPVTLAIALEALAIAPAGAGPDVLSQIERLLLSPPDIHLKEYAVYALLGRFRSRPETGPRAARILLSGLPDPVLPRDRTGQPRPPPGFNESPVPSGQYGRIHHDHPQTRGNLLVLRWVEDALDREVFVDLMPHVLALGITERSDSLRRYWSLLERRDAPAALLAKLRDLDTPAKRAAAVFVADDDSLRTLAARPEGVDLLRSVALDTGSERSARGKAIFAGGEAAADWLDWPRFLAGDDPLLGDPGVLGPPLAAWLAKQPAATQDEVLKLLERTPELRRLRLQVYPRARKEYAAVLLETLGDPGLQGTAVDWLLELGEGQVPDLHHRLLATRAGKRSGKLHELIRGSLDEGLIEPLVKLLDDRDIEVRNLALGSLKAIRDALEEKKEWQAIAEALKSRKKE